MAAHRRPHAVVRLPGHGDTSCATPVAEYSPLLLRALRSPVVSIPARSMGNPASVEALIRRVRRSTNLSPDRSPEPGGPSTADWESCSGQGSRSAGFTTADHTPIALSDSGVIDAASTRRAPSMVGSARVSRSTHQPTPYGGSDSGTQKPASRYAPALIKLKAT